MSFGAMQLEIIMVFSEFEKKKLIKLSLLFENQVEPTETLCALKTEN